MRLEYSVVSFISAALVLVPLPWHWRTRNVCTTSILLWLAITNIYVGINTIVWKDNVDVKYKIWCDIVVKIQVSGNVGVPASIICICRRLAHACSPYHRALDVEGKRRRMKFEIGMCLVLPILVMALHVIVQIYRFILIEEFGCFAVHSRSFPTLLIIEIPPLLLSLASMIYAGVALRWLIHRRVQYLQTSLHAEPIPSGSYMRIIALTISQMTLSLVMSQVLLTIALERGIAPWTSWEYIHENWREIDVARKAKVPELYQTRTMAIRYFVPIASVSVFAYFGFDNRIVADYKNMFTWIRVHIFRAQAKKDVVQLERSIDIIPAGTVLQLSDVISDVLETDDLSTSGSHTWV